MNTFFIVGTLLLLGCTSVQSVTPPEGENKKVVTGKQVIELFTSEGCSSCPSADELMPKLKAQYGDSLIIIAYHVDYWDNLGWKDPFGDPLFSQRQYDYATVLAKESVYTPQAIVNGREDITGSNKKGIQALLSKYSASSQKHNLTLDATKSGKDSVNVKFSTLLEKQEVLRVLLVQTNSSSQVKRGENSGRLLEHYNVVRSMIVTQDAGGNMAFALPQGLDAQEFSIVGIVQNTETMHVLEGTEVGIK